MAFEVQGGQGGSAPSDISAVGNTSVPAGNTRLQVASGAFVPSLATLSAELLERLREAATESSMNVTGGGGDEMSRARVEGHLGAAPAVSSRWTAHVTRRFRDSIFLDY